MNIRDWLLEKHVELSIQLNDAEAAVEDLKQERDKAYEALAVLRQQLTVRIDGQELIEHLKARIAELSDHKAFEVWQNREGLNHPMKIDAVQKGNGKTVLYVK